MNEITSGGLLGGRVAYRQLATGHRTGFEPVLMAAAVPARAGELVLEAGTGAGAALLCLAARVPGMRGVGIEAEPALTRLANENFRANGFTGTACIQGDAMHLPFPSHAFDHVMANPPWFAAHNTASPDARRALAHQAGPGLLGGWINSLTRVLRPRGSITLILPAASLTAAGAALRGAGCGAISLFPLWPRAGAPAKIIIITARRGAKSPDRVLPGLVLHDAAGITAAAQAVLEPDGMRWNRCAIISHA
ncbi:tRNA1(Val) (adenine(37)-N6)-methyltransferase [Acidocella sp.]|uniref:tRNA1(Val) (adenine(37)-N6)-methyltransferase n=1 Tax=Acidocella sp. TaxID=50710 RepID=UPI0017F3A967|nr:methyltransferase domain-containing protein [Acidocella sp.]NNM56892.1 methyltransferase domain-containing protein [Acidocella sp.]